jgi:hypothetical protein
MNGQRSSRLRPGWKTKLLGRKLKKKNKRSFNTSEVYSKMLYLCYRRDLEVMKEQKEEEKRAVKERAMKERVELEYLNKELDEVIIESFVYLSL